MKAKRPAKKGTPPLPKDPNDKEGIRLWKLYMETRLDSGPDHPDAEARENRLSYLLEVQPTKTRLDDLLNTKPRDAMVMREMLDLIRGKQEWEEYMLRRWDDKQQAQKPLLDKQGVRQLTYEDYQRIEDICRQDYPDQFKGFSKYTAQWARELVFERHKEGLQDLQIELNDLADEFARHKDKRRIQRRRARPKQTNAPRS
jgi:hypothetical protein